MNNQILHFTIPDDHHKERLDKFLSDNLPSVTRAKLKKIIEDGHVTVNTEPVTKAGYALRTGDNITISFPPPQPSHLEPEDIPLDIIFEDKYLLVVNKPAGMVVHPAYGNMSGTLVNALLGHCASLSDVGGPIRPGLVHRLDKETSGLLVVAKDDVTHVGLAKQLSAYKIDREYRAIVWGHFAEQQGTVEAALARHPKDRLKMHIQQDGKWAVTHYTLLEELALTSYIKLNLETGRTHQIRVHMASLGHPIFADSTYGGKGKKLAGMSPDRQRFVSKLFKKFTRQMLHAKILAFQHPHTKEFMRFESPDPEDMQKLHHILKSTTV